MVSRLRAVFFSSMLLGCAPRLGADTFLVDRYDDTAPATGGVPGDLRHAISAANGIPDSIVEIVGSATPIVLQAPLPNVANGMTIRATGPAQTISGNSQFRIFFLDFPLAAIRLENLQLVDGLARGGAGGAGGGGGGLGAGGAVFVNAGNVTFDRVVFGNNAGQGGNGGDGGSPANPLAGAGGGGLGGAGGAGDTTGGSGGGGGYYGSGGGAGGGAFNGAGGGGGRLGRGGSGSGEVALGAGGGGGGLENGADASGGLGGVGGIGGGGAGQTAGQAGGGQPGAPNGGGGGGGSASRGASAPGGSGGRFGGGGGAWYRPGFAAASAGAGGDFGGGGGNPHPQGSAGNGGWGGGGGGASVAENGQAGTPGTGGYGGGGGGRSLGTPVNGGAFGGRGGASNASQILAGGGGGGALGGQVFVRPDLGAAVTFIDCTLPAGSLTAGAGGATDPGAVGATVAQAGERAGSGVFFGGSTLTFRGLGTVAIGGDLTDDPALPGAFVKTDDGTVIVTRTVTPTLGTSILGGTLQLGLGGTSGALAGGPILAHGRLVVDRSDTLTLGSVISGNGSLTKSGAGTLILSANNTYLGATTINAGTLQLGNGGSAGAVVERIVNAGTLVFQHGADHGNASDIFGTGGLRKEGPGTLTLSGANTAYSGPTVVNGGILSVDADRRYGIGGLLTLNGGTLRFTGGSESPQRGFTLGAGGGVFDIVNPGTVYSYFGPTSGSGSLTKRGPGTLVLGHQTSNAFGALRVEGGVFRLSGALTTAGTTTVDGSLEIAARGRTWTSSGDLEMGLAGAGASFALSAGTVSFPNLRVGRPGGLGSIVLNGSGATQLSVSGSLLAGLDGPGANATLSAQRANLFASNLVLGRDAGTAATLSALAGSAISCQTLVIGQAGQGTLNVVGGTVSANSSTLGSTASGSGTLNIGAPAGSLPAAGGTVSGTITGGLGAGNLLQVNTTGNASLSNVSGNLSLVISAGTTFVSNLSPAGGTFVNGGILSLVSSGTPISNQTLVRFSVFSPTTSLGPITGSGRVEKLGSGTLTLGETSYTGSTTLSAGGIVLTGASASSEFDFTADGTFLELNVASGTRDLAFALYRFGLGSQTLRKTGAGTVRWPNGFKFALNGLISVDAGEFIGGGFPGCNWVDNRAALTVAAGAVFRGFDANVLVGVLNGAGTITTGSASPSYEGLTAGALANGTFSGSITDTDAAHPGRFIKAGSATQILTGTVQLTRGVVIADGTLQIGNGGTVGTLLANVVNRGTLAFRRSDSYVFAGDISGTGATNHSGGTLTLSGNSSTSGTLTVQAGRVFLSGFYGGGFTVLSSARLSLAGGSVGQLGRSSIVQAGGTVDGFGTLLGTVQNSGTLTAAAGQTIVFRDGPVTNAAGGVLRALQGGVLDFSAAPSLANSGLIDLISGTVLFPVNFTNSGVLLDSRVVRVKSADRVANTVTVTIDGYSAHTYQLQRSTDLAGTSFVNLGAPQAGVTGNTLTFTDPNALETRVFYRVAVD